MTLFKSKIGFRLMSALPLALAVSLWCSGRGGPAGDGGDSARVYEAAPPAASAAYWAADRIEDGDGEDIAVLEDLETLRTEERPVKELPAGVEEGQVLTGDGALRIDKAETATRAARIFERFERLKAD